MMVRATGSQDASCTLIKMATIKKIDEEKLEIVTEIRTEVTKEKLLADKAEIEELLKNFDK